MRVATWLMLLTLLAATAGCVDRSADDDGTDEGGEETTEDPLRAEHVALQLTECAVIEVFATVDAGVAAGLVPDDFELVETNGQAVAVFGGNRCTMDGADVFERTFLALSVTPRSETLMAEDERSYYWEPEHAVSDNSSLDVLLTDLHAAHAKAQRIIVEVESTAAKVSVLTADDEEHVGEGIGTTTTPELARGFGSFREYFAADGGYGYFEAGYGTSTGTYGGATGTLTTAPDTPTRTVFGAESTRPFITGVGYTFEEAAVGFIPVEADAASTRTTS